QTGALLAVADGGALDELTRAQVELLRGYAAVGWGDSRDAAKLLLDAARRLELIDVGLARDTYIMALGAASTASSLAREPSLGEAARAARAAPPLPPPERPLDVLLDGLAMFTTDGLPAAAPTLRRALVAVRAAPLSPASQERGLALGATTLLWDYESLHAMV